MQIRDKRLVLVVGLVATLLFGEAMPASADHLCQNTDPSCLPGDSLVHFVVVEAEETADHVFAQLNDLVRFLCAEYGVCN